MNTRKNFSKAILLLVLFVLNRTYSNAQKNQFHRDTAFTQAFSVKYYPDEIVNNNRPTLLKVCSDRNGAITILSSKGLLKPSGGQMLHPGQLIRDKLYRPLLDMHINGVNTYDNQCVYLDDNALLSNAWAGSLYSKHSLQGATIFAGGANFSFLLARDQQIQCIKDSKIVWTGNANDKVLDILFDPTTNSFWVLTSHSVSVFNPDKQNFSARFKGENFTAFTFFRNNKAVVIGTDNGYITINAATGIQQGTVQQKLPARQITVVKNIAGNLWFGTVNGVFMMQDDGSYKYYASKRWLPSDRVVDIAAGSNNSVLILTDEGLSQIHFTKSTLYDKAMFYEQQVRQRHLRFGFNSSLSGLKEGDVNTGSLVDSDNDGLWTSMYLGAEVFRYAVTRSPEALANCKESLDAIERLYTINSLKGFPSRSFERSGYEISDVHHREVNADNTVREEYPGNGGLNESQGPWRQAPDSGWHWKSTTSSDEAIGHMFVFGAIAELIDEPQLKGKAIKLMDALMQHIVDHEWYMIDWDGKPTRWGRWNPEYVNARPEMVGDRKITSSNIISMLQTAYHFTGKKIYKDKAFELMNQHGYLDNLMRPMKQIGSAPSDADELSKELSDGWNHSDDEMYFLGYWGLYRYALNDTLKKKFKTAIIDHWEIERPEKEAAWNIFTALTGKSDIDLPEAVWYLQKYPLDLVDWKVSNSQRGDINFVPDNFRKQTIEKVLPPDELRITRHNSNRFDLDGGDANGGEEYSAGDIWLLPYWLGRYLKVIGSPADNSTGNGLDKVGLR